MIKPVNLEALSKWVEHFPDDIRQEVRLIAPMLEKLGYDPYAYPPNYGDPDSFVSQNTAYVEHNKKYFEQKKQEVYSVSKTQKGESSNINKTLENTKPAIAGHLRLDRQDPRVSSSEVINQGQVKQVGDSLNSDLGGGHAFGKEEDYKAPFRQRLIRGADYSRQLAYAYRDQPLIRSLHNIVYNDGNS